MIRVVRFFSKAPVGAQLNWSVREKECYGIFYGVRLFEDLLDNRLFILKTDHKNLTYLNVTLTENFISKIKTSTYVMFLERRAPDALSRLCENYMPVKPVQAGQQGSAVILAALQPKQSLPDKVYDKIAAVHNSSKGHWG